MAHRKVRSSAIRYHPLKSPTNPMKKKLLFTTTSLLLASAIAYAASVCTYCNGTGKNPTDDLSGSVPTFGNDQGTMYCSICKRTVQKPHIHGPCPVCHGTGKTR